LRDYRFYADDMLHPNSQAVDYVWQRFSATYCDTKALQLAEEIRKIGLAKMHRPFNFQSESYKHFLENNLTKIENLLSRYPFLNLTAEKQHFAQQLNELFYAQ